MIRTNWREFGKRCGVVVRCCAAVLRCYDAVCGVMVWYCDVVLRCRGTEHRYGTRFETQGGFMDNSIGVYIHIPFCKSKCYYCDFNSYSGREHLAGSYFETLFSEIKGRAADLEGRLVRSIFIGGGTPSMVNPAYIVELLEVCSNHMQVDIGAEISMESNPGTLTYEHLRAYRAAGVNRLSIGLQAWQDRLLRDLGRIHNRQQYVENLDAAHRAGFRNINTDLIFGLPGQTFEDWAETLEAVTTAGREGGRGEGSIVPLTHLSCYDLKIEEGTVFGDRLDAGTLKPAEDELDRRMYHYAIETLAKKDFRQYEISNFARPGYECRHNIVYWKAREYAGFGAGAHSYLDGFRFSNVQGIEQYIERVNYDRQLKDQQLKDPKNNNPQLKNQQLKDPKHNDWQNNDPQPIYQTELQYIDQQEAMSEFMILGLRLTDGIYEWEFGERFGKGLKSVYGDKLDRLVQKGLLIYEQIKGCYRLSKSGLDFANEVFIEFI